MKIFCDSSLTENCIVVNGETPRIEYYHDKPTVNEGEYRAVMRALLYAKTHQSLAVWVETDSLLVVNQLYSKWECKKPHLKALRDEMLKLMAEWKGLAIVTWVPREENPAGIALEKIYKKRLAHPNRV